MTKTTKLIATAAAVGFALYWMRRGKPAGKAAGGITGTGGATSPGSASASSAPWWSYAGSWK